MSPRVSVAAAALWAFLACQTPQLPAPPAVSFSDGDRVIREQAAPLLEAFQNQPLNAEANGNLGMLLHAYDRLEGAEVFYARASVLEPQQLRWFYYRGCALAGLGRPEEALQAFQAVLSRNPSDPYTLARLGGLHDQLASYDDALAAYDQAAASQPSLPQAHFGAGRTLLRQGLPEQAIPRLQRALQLAGSFGAGHLVLADAYRQAGRPTLSEKQLALAERYKGSSSTLHDPALSEVHRLNHGVPALTERARALMMAGNHLQAAALLERAAATNPRNISTRVNLVAVYTELGYFSSAQQHYQEGLAINPDFPPLPFSIALLHFKRERWSQAETQLRRTLELDPLHSQAAVYLARTLRNQGRASEAQSYFARAAEIDPSLAATALE